MSLRLRSIPVSGVSALSSLLSGSARLASLLGSQIVIVSPKAALLAVGSMTIPQNHHLPHGCIAHGAFPPFEQNNHRRVSLADDTATL
jgi:hypothetical protein